MFTPNAKQVFFMQRAYIKSQFGFIHSRLPKFRIIHIFYANIKYSTTVKNLRMQSVVRGKPGTAEWQSYCLAAEGVNRRVGPSWRINTRSHIWFCSDLKKFTSRKTQSLLFKLLELKKDVSSHSLLNLLQQRVKEVATRLPLSGIYVL